MESVRPAAVEGTFYPRSKDVLRATVERLIAEAAEPASTAETPRALVAPHAGYVYSGPIAARAYATLRGRPIERVLLLGPAHRVCVRGFATPTVSAFATPLGQVRVDREAIARLEALPGVGPFDRAHEDEHSLEVHLPFLQVVLGDVAVAPVLVGDAAPDEVARVIDAYGDDPRSLVIVSTDLSHYLDDRTAKALDRETCRAIEALDPDAIGDDQACGRIPLRGLLLSAKRRGLRVHTLDLRNSGDSTRAELAKRPHDWVVGYGAWRFDRA